MPKMPRSMKRRRFVTLMALGSAALVTAPLSRAAAAAARARKAEASPRVPSSAIRKEIATQEKGLKDQLKTIRDFELPPGSPMAFVFEPLRARRRR
jgi:hypothetical protein